MSGTVELDDLVGRISRLVPAGVGMELMVRITELRQERDRARDKLLELARGCDECHGEGSLDIGETRVSCGKCDGLRRAAR
jgi:hypothetical protein